MMSYDDFMAKNTTEYRGFLITFGSVRDKNGDRLTMAACRMIPTEEEKAALFDDAKAWIDKFIGSQFSTDAANPPQE